MINSMRELQECLSIEKELYVGGNKNMIKLALLQDHDYLLWKYVRSLRFTEYHYNLSHRFRYWLWQRIKNRRGARLGITIWRNAIDSGLRIWHYGSIIVNGHARIGKNCQLHGDNCIGNKGDFDQSAPTIGDNVDIGVGAKIIGGIYIADNIKIGANAVVTKSCYEQGSVLVGAPAKIIKRGSL